MIAHEPTRFPAFLFAFAFVASMTNAQSKGRYDLDTTSHVLLLEGITMDDEDRPIAGARVRVEVDGKELAQWNADTKGRFAVELDIGTMYAIDVVAEAYVKKRFIVDTRTEDPASIVTVPFEAHVSLIKESDMEGADLGELDFPFAFVTYDAKEKAYMADPVYIEEMKRLESALMLSSARARKRRPQ